jgi:site-specific recombinase XerD
MTFPLLDDVAAALVDYFKNGRPETSCRNIFVRHNAPYEAFGQDDNLHYIINKYMKISGFTDFHHRKRGLHSLRHSIAGNMLNQGVPMPTISEVLGHSSTDTTMIYTKIGTGQLRNCALEVD